MIYLDNSATTKPLEASVEASSQCMREFFFNPSAAYSPAVAVERKVKAARENVAATLGTSPEEIVYTSGGTESNNTAVFGALRSSRAGKHLITTVSEHPSVYEVFRLLESRYGYEVTYLGAAPDGSVSLEELEAALRPDTALVSLMHVNNETGAVTDLNAAASLIRRLAPQAVFHADGVQAYGKLPFGAIPADMYSVSGHKLHAPKGIGFLYVRKGIPFAGGLIGGGQERGLRSGTTNAPGILALDAAISAFRNNQSEWIAGMRACKRLLAAELLTIEDAAVNGPRPEEGAPHILNVSFPGVRGEVLLHALEQKEIFVSTGSACSTHKKGDSRVLSAINVTGERREGALRFSLCPFNTQEEMIRTAEEVCRQVEFLRRYRRR